MHNNPNTFRRDLLGTLGAGLTRDAPARAAGAAESGRRSAIISPGSQDRAP